VTTPIDAADPLDALLARWAGRYQLTDEQAGAVRAAILQSTAEPPVELDADWLWGLLRPVTSLLDGPHRLNDRLSGLIFRRRLNPKGSKCHAGSDGSLLVDAPAPRRSPA
jgi:hypothetical protein